MSLRAGYPLTKDGKKVHAVSSTQLRQAFDAFNAGTTTKLETVSLCGAEVEVKNTEKFDVFTTNTTQCKRCRSDALARDGEFDDEPVSA